MNYPEAVSYINEIPKFTTKNDLEHTRRLLRWLGSPEESFPVIHVAGSNGKGSVCAFLSEICQEAGRKTGLFTSPHLISVRERFTVNGVMISEEDFLSVFNEVLSCVKAHEGEQADHPTYFEFLFLMGVVYFARQQVDMAILETGLGGRLDATNSVAKPRLCIITSISLEHTQYLGDTIEQVAGEKAGIIKPGVPVIYDASNPAAAQVMEEVAEKQKAPALGISPIDYKIVSIGPAGIDFSYVRQYDERVLHIQMPAEYQAMNGSLALTAAQELFSDEEKCPVYIRNGLAKTRWPGRMEEISPEVYLDGAHNPDGIRVFLETVRRLSAGYEKKPILLFAVVQDKNYEAMIQTLCRDDLWSHIIVTQIQGERALSEEELISIMKTYATCPVEGYLNSAEAYYRALDLKEKDQLVFAAGSLYFVGELKGLNGGN